MLECISNLKHRTRPKPVRNGHPWKMHSSDWFKSRSDAYDFWKSEGIDMRIKKSMRKGTGPLAVAC